MSEKIEVSREQWMDSVNSYVGYIHNGKPDKVKCGFCEVLEKEKRNAKQKSGARGKD